jgi:predicted O-methyltransferase YrrM
VILSPFSTWKNREWSIYAWQTLERILEKAGLRPLVIDRFDSNQPNRHNKLTSEKLLNANAELVAGVLLNSLCLIGNDSGMAHFAGIMGIPTIALCGQVTGKDIYGLYPSVHVVQGKLHCDGCWWQTPYDGARCDNLCASIATILPNEVMAAVQEILHPNLKVPLPVLRVITQDRANVLKKLAAQTKNVPGDVAELGVYRGGSARDLAAACPDKTIHLFDTFSGLPESEGNHTAGGFSASLEEARITGNRVVYYQGLFPETTVSLRDDQRFSLVHVDADLEPSTLAAIEFFWPRLSPGGAIVFDDYQWKDCPGVTKAVDAFFRPEEIRQDAFQQCYVVKEAADGRNSQSACSEDARGLAREMASA